MDPTKTTPMLQTSGTEERPTVSPDNGAALLTHLRELAREIRQKAAWGEKNDPARR